MLLTSYRVHDNFSTEIGLRREVVRDSESSLTRERLKELLDYNPETGIFRWRRTRGGAKAGMEIKNLVDNRYVGVQLDGVPYYCHRLAWFYVTGAWPRAEIDHIDRCSTNNAIANLREATSSENKRNQKISRCNSSGVAGVSWCKRTQKWQARIYVSRRAIFLGRYQEKEAAVAARVAGEKCYFGDFIRTP
jgi:hypothetical protein